MLVTLSQPSGAAPPGINGEIAFTYGDELRTINLDGAPGIPLPEAEITDFPSFSPSGKEIVFDGHTGIEVISAEGNGPSRLLASVTQAPSRPAIPPDPSFSPDGKRVIFHSFDEALGAYEIYVINADGTGKTELTNSRGVSDLYPAYSPDGTQIVFSSNNGHRYNELFVMNADGSDTRQLTTSVNGDDDLSSFSPDGKKIIFEHLTGSSAYVSEINGDGSGQTQLGGPVDPGRDSFSPDGQRILLPLNGHVCVMNGDGTNIKVLATGGDPAWQALIRAPRKPRVTRGHKAPKRLIWADNFTGSAGAGPDPVKWNLDTGGNGWGNKELEYYTPSVANASLDGQGHLVITARAELYKGPDGVTRPFTSARLQTYSNFSFKYGLMEARIKVPAGRGLLPTFWSLGNSAYSRGSSNAAGEIDTMEVIGSTPRVVRGTLHGPWRWAPAGIGGVKRVSRPLSEGFHTYGVEWSSNQIKFLLDGLVYATIKRSKLRRGAGWPFTQPNFLLLDLAVGGIGPGPPTAATRFPASMTVDWVRVWQ
jgi:hypothetical protein